MGKDYLLGLVARSTGVGYITGYFVFGSCEKFEYFGMDFQAEILPLLFSAGVAEGFWLVFDNGSLPFIPCLPVV
jgi:hypothetical protein